MTDPARQALPIPDYDHLPVGSLESRIRSLDQAGVEALLTYESTHGDREPVMTVLRARLEALHGGAKPSGGSAGAGSMPEAGSAATSDTGVGPQTTGPSVAPPTHGVPSSRGEPRRNR